mmetsp:Transcript_13802/g.31852  ORF Transcript_13802/g.31852 Transcript_13802/m.31852 type:complete len:193 (+) Transcript_13802:614-1192(+)
MCREGSCRFQRRIPTHCSFWTASADDDPARQTTVQHDFIVVQYKGGVSILQTRPTSIPMAVPTICHRMSISRATCWHLYSHSRSFLSRQQGRSSQSIPSLRPWQPPWLDLMISQHLKQQANMLVTSDGSVGSQEQVSQVDIQNSVSSKSYSSHMHDLMAPLSQERHDSTMHSENDSHEEQQWSNGSEGEERS